MTLGIRFLAFFLEGVFVAVFGVILLIFEYFFLGGIYVAEKIVARFIKDDHPFRFGYSNNYYRDRSPRYWIACSFLIFNIIFQILDEDVYFYIAMGVLTAIAIFYGLNKLNDETEYSFNLKLSGVKQIGDDKNGLEFFSYFALLFTITSVIMEIYIEVSDYGYIELEYSLLLLITLLGSIVYTNSRLIYARRLLQVEIEQQREEGGGEGEGDSPTETGVRPPEEGV